MHKDVEEILELIWTFKEKGKTVKRDVVIKASKVNNTALFLDEMLEKNYIKESDGIITLTPS